MFCFASAIPGQDLRAHPGNHRPLLHALWGDLHRLHPCLRLADGPRSPWRVHCLASWQPRHRSSTCLSCPGTTSQPGPGTAPLAAWPQHGTSRSSHVSHIHWFSHLHAQVRRSNHKSSKLNFVAFRGQRLVQNFQTMSGWIIFPCFWFDTKDGCHSLQCRLREWWRVFGWWPIVSAESLAHLLAASLMTTGAWKSQQVITPLLCNFSAALTYNDWFI